MIDQNNISDNPDIKKSIFHNPHDIFCILLWGVGVTIGIFMIWSDLSSHNGRVPYGRDFANLWVAGKLAWQGRIADIYDIELFRTHLYEFTGIKALQNYSYPPTALLIALPFSLLPYFPSLTAWTVAGILFFSWAAKRETSLPPWLTAFTPAGMINIWTGHYGFLLGGLWLLFFRSIGTVRSGVIASFMTFKPHMGLLIGVAALHSRKTFVSAILFAMALALISAVTFGLDSWIDFFSRTSRFQMVILTQQTEEQYFLMMPSAYVAFGRNIYSILFQLIFAISAILLLIFKSKKPDPFIYSTATFLILPYVFNYDMTVVSLGFYLLIYNKWNRLYILEKAIVSLGFISPALTFSVDVFVPPILLLGLNTMIRINNLDTPAPSGFGFPAFRGQGRSHTSLS